MMRMQRLRIVQVYSGMAVVMASSLLPLALGVELAGSPAGAATPPLCRTSQLSVSVAPIYTNLHSGNLLVNITFTNRGRTCELGGETPDVVTVVGAKHAPIGHDIVAYLPYVPPVVLTQRESSLSALSVIRKTANAKGCQPVTTDGLVIVDGLPNGSSRYVHYVVRGVCASAAHPNLMQGMYYKPVAGAATPPLCRTSQLSVSVAPSYTNLHSENLLVNITFTNNGSTCKLLGEVPDVATVVGTKHIPVGSGFSYPMPYVPPIVLTKGQSSLSVLSVIRKTANAKGCQPLTTDGLVIVDGLPNGSSRYVHYVIHGVCSSPAHPNLMVGMYNKPVA
jgi:archaellum component FlaF (FlaF/FlaG flagellin family)